MSDTTCPGCGTRLADRSDAPDPGPRRASPACLALAAEVAAREFEHPAILARWHQMTVDAYAAQHVGPDAPSIGPAFALIGLYLAVERGLGGPQVRDAHHFLATPKREWPRFEPPLTAWPVTVRDVAAAGGPEAHAQAVQRWGASVWEAWRAAHDEVRGLTDPLLADWRPRGS